MDISLELPIGSNSSDGEEVSPPKGMESISDDKVADFYQEMFRVADNIRNPRKVIWDQCWDLYNGVYDWSGKADWQSKANIAKVRQVVDKATAKFRTALIKMKRFYQIESETRLGIEKGMFTMSLMDYWLDRVNFVSEFSVGLKSGLITSTLVYKVWWDWISTQEPFVGQEMVKEPILELGIKIGEREVLQPVLRTDERTIGVMGFKAVNPYNFWVGPKGSYHIERTTAELAYLENVAKKKPGVYDRETLEKLRATSTTSYEQKREANKKKEGVPVPVGKYRREVDLYHYWGDIYDENGKILMHNATFTMAGAENSRLVLRKPRKNPFLHGTSPYVHGTPYVVPFSTYNRGIVEDIIGIATMITELSNLIIDGAQFDAIKGFEIDTDIIDNPFELKKGHYPGKAWATKSFNNPTNKQAIRPIDAGQIPREALMVLDRLDKEKQLSSGIISSFQGGGEGFKTATEFAGASSGASEGLDDAARTVEETTINPFLEKFAKTIYQYHEDYALPRLTENFQQTASLMQPMTPEERYAIMVGGYGFKARGISIFLDKQQNSERAAKFFELIANIPGVLEMLGKEGIAALIEELVIAFGFNPSKIVPGLGAPPVISPAILAGQELPTGANGLPSFSKPGLTLSQASAGEQGRRLGGSTNNPQANFGLQ